MNDDGIFFVPGTAIEWSVMIRLLLPSTVNIYFFQMFVILYKLSLYNGIRVTVAHEIDKVDNFAHFTDVVTEFSPFDAARWSHTE